MNLDDLPEAWVTKVRVEDTICAICLHPTETKALGALVIRRLVCDRDEKIVPLFWTLNRLFSDEEYKSSKIVTAAHVSGMFTKVLHFEIQNRDSLIAGLKTPCSRLVTEGQYLNQFLELIASLTNLKLLPRTLPMSLSDVNEVWAQPHERIMAAVLSIK